MAHSIEQALKATYWSRNGVLFSELLEITALPETLLRLTVCELQRRSILQAYGALIHLSHHDVQDALQLKYSNLSSTDSMLQWTERLTTYYIKSPNTLICRSAEEVPWLLKRANLKKELYHIILTVDILVQLYSGGRGEELLGYWKQLDSSLNFMAAQYYTALRSIEEQQELCASLSVEGVCSMFRTVGKVVSNLGFPNEALPLLQHYLQLCEAHFEPDGVEVASAFAETAEAYAHIGRYGVAEEYYYQALSIFEVNPEVSTLQVLKVIEALVGVLEKLKRMDIAQALSTKAFAMKNMSKLNNTPGSILRTRANHLEQFCSEVESDVDTASAHKLNEYAVLMTLFGDSSVAEELFLRSWKAYESQFGDVHLMVVKPLQNLALFYSQTGRVEKATSLYEKVYEIIKKNDVSPSPQMTEVTGKLATLYRQQNKLDLAEPLQIKFAELKEKELGPHHLDVARALNNLAVMYSIQDEYAKALPTYDRALRAYRHNFPEDHPTVSTVVQNRQLAAHILEQNLMA
jgi:tetratricopeptide (TPR) repeat protein